MSRQRKRNIRKQRREYQPTGMLDAVGFAYIFLLPFDILAVPASDVVREVIVDGSRVMIYWPFRNDLNPQPTVPLVQLRAIPYRAATAPPHYRAAALKRLHLEIGKEPTVYANGLRMDFIPDVNPAHAEKIARQFLGLMRWWTRQWWITRDRQHDEGYLRNGFRINSSGERLEGVHAFAKRYAGFGFEQRLTPELFASICRNLSEGRDIPLSMTAFLDAIYYHANADIRRSIFEAAVACETLLEEHLRPFIRQGINRQEVKSAFRGTNLPRHISLDMQDLVGRSFEVEHPDQFRLVQHLWTARGNVAHGKPPIVVQNGARREVGSEDLFSMLRAVFELFRWFEIGEVHGWRRA